MHRWIRNFVFNIQHYGAPSPREMVTNLVNWWILFSLYLSQCVSEGRSGRARKKTCKNWFGLFLFFFLLAAVRCVHEWSMKYFGYSWGNEHIINFISYLFRWWLQFGTHLKKTKKTNKQSFDWDLLRQFFDVPACLCVTTARYTDDLRCVIHF